MCVKTVLIFAILATIISCKHPKNVEQEDQKKLEKKINQKLSLFNIRVCIPNAIDTTEVYDSLFYKIVFTNNIKYLDSCIVIKNVTIKDSTKMFIEFVQKEDELGLKDVSFYNSNNTIRFIYSADTLLQNINTKIKCNEIRKKYSDSGNLLELEYYGHYGVWGVPVGTSRKYSLDGDILEEISFEYWGEREGKRTTTRFESGIKKEILIEQYDAHHGVEDTIRHWRN